MSKFVVGAFCEVFFDWRWVNGVERLKDFKKLKNTFYFVPEIMGINDLL